MVVFSLNVLQVKELAGRCTCPVQFPIIKVGEGKYKIGDSQTLVFVRVSFIIFIFKKVNETKNQYKVEINVHV